MAIPNVSISVRNGGLGVAASKSDGIQAIVGRISAAEFGDITSSANQIAVDTPTQFGSVDALTAACGKGVVAQAAALVLQAGHPVVVCRAADDSAETSTGAGDAVTFQTAVVAAVKALQDSSLTFELCHVVCDASTGASPSYPTSPLSASDCVSLVSALDLKAKDFFAAHHYDGAFFVLELAESSGAAPSLTGAASDYVAVCQGYVQSVNPITGADQKNPLAWHACQRCSEVGLGRDLAATSDGPLSGVTSVAHDEAAHGGACDDAKVTTARTFPRHAGVYLTNARIISSASSDFEFWQHRRVMNAACAAAYDYLFTLLSDFVLVESSTGHIVESAAKAIEANVESAVKDRVGEWVSDVSASVDRNGNILSTHEVPVSVSIVPLGYIKSITVQIGFKNPALAQA